MTDAAELLRRYLQQRVQLGERELFLDRFGDAEVRSALTGPSPVQLVSARELVAAQPHTATSIPSAAELVQIGSLAEVRSVALGCPACSLAETRQHVVFGEGHPQAELMIVGEAPGAEEDRTGRPFVGKAGQLLNLLLAAVGFERESVYICNVLKCRPPGNRNPRPEEVEACSPYLLRQVELVSPRAILACGTFAAQTLLGTVTPISALRGRVHEYQGVPLIPTYHPAALLRNSSWVRLTWEDLQRMRAVVDN